MPITESRKRKRGRITPTTASAEKERESIASVMTDEECAERQVRFYEGLKADLNLFLQFHAQNPKDVQNLRNLGLTMTRLALTPSLDQNTKQIIDWLKGGAEMLGEVSTVDARDHEARFYLGMAHYQYARFMYPPPLAGVERDIYKNHCEKAYACFSFLQEEAPEVYDSVPWMLERAWDSLLEVCPEARNSESSDGEFSDSSGTVLMSDQSCNMRQDMMQDAVEMLLKAMSILPDDDGEVVDKLANQIYLNPWTGNMQGTEYRRGLLASAKDAKEALVLDSRYALPRHTEDNHNRATDENMMLMKFVGMLFEAMSLGTYQRYKVAREKSVKDLMLVQELTSLRRQVDTMMMKLSESP